MTDNNGARSGSLQFYPRVRAKKVMPRVNWKIVSKDSGLKGFVGYKVGMISVYAKDDTENSMTKGKRITIPATVLECPKVKIYSVRFYKNGKVLKDLIVTNEKILKRSVKLPKKVEEFKEVEDFDDVRVVLYTDNKNTCTDKKKADLVEMDIGGSKDDKLAFIKENLMTEFSVKDVFQDGLVDVRGVTKGYGTQGTVKRFGIAYKDHKSEKGVKRPGSIGSFGKRRVEFRAPQAGQTGYHKRIAYNNLILDVGSISEKDINPKSGFEHYGVVKNDYIILKGSVLGPKKRGLVITPAMRPTKLAAKKKFEILELQ